MHPSFSENVIQNEKKAVLTELKMLMNTPEYTLSNEFNKLFYLPEGLQYMNDASLQIRNISAVTSHLYQTHQQLYTSTNMVFVVYGNVTLSTITSMFRKLLIPSTVISIPPQVCYSYTSSFLHVKKESSTVMTIIGFPMRRQYDSSEMVKECLKMLLFNELRMKHKLVYGITCSVTTNHCSTSLLIQFECIHSVFIKTLRILFHTLDQYTRSIDPSILKGIQRKLIYAYSTDYEYDEYYTSYLYHPRPLLTKQQLLNHVKSFTSKQFISFMKEIIQFQQCTLVYQ